MESRERLDKRIASRSGMSRSQVRELVRNGLVRVNGGLALSADMKVGESDEIMVRGRPFAQPDKLYLMMNKPSGVLSATRDKKQKTALDLVPREYLRPGLFPAGRLDKDAEGFLLITDDGAFAHRILAPNNHIPKTYFVQFAGTADGKFIVAEFAKGVALGGGDASSPAELEISFDGGGRGVATLTIYEGVFHQVKRMFARFGLEVTYLKRIRIGGLELDPNMAPGECRAILHNERKTIC